MLKCTVTKQHCESESIYQKYMKDILKFGHLLFSSQKRNKK